MPAIPATDLQLIEIFSSLQGEGVLIGQRQLFVRLAECNLACSYCDTGHDPGPTWRAEREPGSVELVEYSNPASIDDLTGLVAEWQRRLPVHQALVLTGGEPLLQEMALANWLPRVSKVLPVYLETNGTLPNVLSALLAHLTWISMDLKLARFTGQATPWEAHADFLKLAGNKTCQIKVVIDAGADDKDLDEAAAFVHLHAPDVPLILQPRTIHGRPAITGRRLLALQATVARIHPLSLVIPQAHPLLAIY